MSQNPRKRALIVTICALAEGGNLGNALQHYALQEAVKSLRYDSESLICPSAKLPPSTQLKRKIIITAKRAAKLILAILGSKKYRMKLREKFTGNSEHTPPWLHRTAYRNLHQLLR